MSKLIKPCIAFFMHGPAWIPKRVRKLPITAVTWAMSWEYRIKGPSA